MDNSVITKETIIKAADLKIELSDLGYTIKNTTIKNLEFNGVLFSVHKSAWGKIINNGRCSNEPFYKDAEGWRFFKKLLLEYGFLPRNHGVSGQFFCEVVFDYYNPYGFNHIGKDELILLKEIGII